MTVVLHSKTVLEAKTRKCHYAALMYLLILHLSYTSSNSEKVRQVDGWMDESQWSSYISFCFLTSALGYNSYVCCSHRVQSVSLTAFFLLFHSSYFMDGRVNKVEDFLKTRLLDTLTEQITKVTKVIKFPSKMWNLNYSLCCMHSTLYKSGWFLAYSTCKPVLNLL